MFESLVILDRMMGLAEAALLQWEGIQSAPRFVMHRENAVYKVSTTTGSAALRLHRPGYHDRPEILSELQWMAYLAECNIQVPKPMATRQGSLLAEVSDDQGQTYLVDLLTWMDGEPLGKSGVPLAFSAERLGTIFFDIGRSIAELHKVTDTWTLPKNFKRHALDKEGLLGETAAWGKFWAASCLSGNDKEILQRARQRAALQLDALTAAGADYGLIHADFVRENILISHGSVQFIDFDDSAFGFRMFDLATALTKNRAEPAYPALRSNLLDGYKTVRALSSLDEQSLDLFLTLRDFAYLSWIDDRRHEPLIGPRLLGIKEETMAAAIAFLK